MNFECNEIEISDCDFGCTITLSDTINKEYDENLSYEEIINSDEKYILIQRTYPEDFDESDFYYIETTESDVELGAKDKIFIEFEKELFKIRWSVAMLEIRLNIESGKIDRLKKILKKRFKEKIIMKINE